MASYPPRRYPPRWIGGSHNKGVHTFDYEWAPTIRQTPLLLSSCISGSVTPGEGGGGTISCGLSGTASCSSIGIPPPPCYVALSCAAGIGPHPSLSSVIDSFRGRYGGAALRQARSRQDWKLW